MNLPAPIAIAPPPAPLTQRIMTCCSQPIAQLIPPMATEPAVTRMGMGPVSASWMVVNGRSSGSMPTEPAANADVAGNTAGIVYRPTRKRNG